MLRSPKFRLSNVGDDDVRARNAAMHASITQRMATKIIVYPAVLGAIRNLRATGITWKEVTMQMKDMLIEHGLAKPRDFTKERIRTMAQYVAAAHNTRRDAHEEICKIQRAIRGDAALEEFVMTRVHDRGNHRAPIRDELFRRAMIEAGLRPEQSDGRATSVTRMQRKIAIQHFNNLCAIAIAELHLRETDKFYDEGAWAQTSAD